MANRLVVVTGANKGLGFAVVKGLCQKWNGTICLTARDENKGLKAVKILNELGLKPVFHQLDISDRDSVKKFADFVETNYGAIDVLVNNAAILEWDEVYPSFEAAKRSVDINYRGLVIVEEYLFPLLREDARVVNVSSPCAHLSNLKNKKWIDVLRNPALKTEQINEFVDEYLKSVKNGTFNKNEFADDGKHAEYRVSKIAFTALSMIQQKKYKDMSINVVHPGHIKTDMAHGGGEIDADEAAEIILYLVFEAPPNMKGCFMWYNRKLVDWYDPLPDLASHGIYLLLHELLTLINKRYFLFMKDTSI